MLSRPILPLALIPMEHIPLWLLVVCFGLAFTLNVLAKKEALFS